MSDIYENLKKSIVKINVPPSEQGTGFFIAQGLIITCKHVIKETDKKEIIITDPDQEQFFVVKDIKKHSELDIVLIYIETEEINDCVEIDTKIEPFDDVYASGFPVDLLENNASLGRIEDKTYDGSLLTFESKTIRPGFSGSPLLNRRTQKICGVVKRDTRVRLRGNIQQGYGGGAIPFSRIFEAFSDNKDIRSLAAKNNVKKSQATISVKSEEKNNCDKEEQIYLVIPVFKKGIDKDEQFYLDNPLVYLSDNPEKIPLLSTSEIEATKKNKGGELVIDKNEILDFVRRSIMNVKSQYSCDISNVIVFLYLPTELLRKFLLKHCEQSKNVLKQYKIVLSCSDRYDKSCPPENTLELRQWLESAWKRFEDKLSQVPDRRLSNLTWMTSTDANEGQLFEDYQAFNCFGDWLKSNNRDNWDELIQSGIPLALWICDRRLEPVDPQECQEYFDRLKSHDPLEFLKAIPRVQSQLQRVFKGERLLGVLYENPDYIPIVPPEPSGTGFYTGIF